MGESSRRAEAARAAAAEAIEVVGEVAAAKPATAPEVVTVAAEEKAPEKDAETETIKHLLVLAHIVRANAGRLDRFERFDYESAISFLRKKLGTKPLPDPIWPR